MLYSIPGIALYFSGEHIMYQCVEPDSIATWKEALLVHAAAPGKHQGRVNVVTIQGEMTVRAGDTLWKIGAYDQRVHATVREAIDQMERAGQLEQFRASTTLWKLTAAGYAITVQN